MVAANKIDDLLKRYIGIVEDATANENVRKTCKLYFEALMSDSDVYTTDDSDHSCSPELQAAWKECNKQEQSEVVNYAMSYITELSMRSSIEGIDVLFDHDGSEVTE